MLATAAFAQKVESYTSTQQNGWEKQKVEVSRNISSKAIELNKNDKAQEVKGIGGCFNEMGWGHIIWSSSIRSAPKNK